MSWYVHREGTREDLLTGEPVPTAGWVGPIRSRAQAEKEKEAWESAGHTATVEESTAEVVAKVRAWEKAVHPGRVR